MCKVSKENSSKNSTTFQLEFAVSGVQHLWWDRMNRPTKALKDGFIRLKC